jgi:hypothetical protein
MILDVESSKSSNKSSVEHEKLIWRHNKTDFVDRSAAFKTLRSQVSAAIGETKNKLTLLASNFMANEASRSLGSLKDDINFNETTTHLHTDCMAIIDRAEKSSNEHGKVTLSH